MVEWIFRRYVNGVEMAEGVKITRAASLDDAMRKAASMFPDCGTVLILENAAEIGRVEAFEEISEAIKWRWPDAAALVDEMAREGK